MNTRLLSRLGLDPIEAVALTLLVLVVGVGSIGVPLFWFGWMLPRVWGMP